jgi:tRNA-dihydrouridine synthase
LEELIIHPRTQKDFYGNKPDLQVFKDALSLSANPVCYNGDIFTAEDLDKLMKAFPELNTIMLGRGILANPGLMNEIKDNTFADKKVLKDFHDEIFSNYIELFNEDRNAMRKMKELWGYMAWIFSDNKKYAKKIKKSQNVRDYNDAVLSLFSEQEIIKGAGLFNS